MARTFGVGRQLMRQSERLMVRHHGGSPSLRCDVTISGKGVTSAMPANRNSIDAKPLQAPAVPEATSIELVPGITAG
jgi:hypothetical protein